MAEKIANTKRTAGPVVVGPEYDIHIDPTSASHSIYVTGFPTTTTSDALLIHFQRKKNGGGDIGSITITKPGAAVITFDSPEVVQSVLQQKQKFEGVVLTVEPYVESTQKDDQNFEVFELVSAELCLETVEFLTQEQTSTLLKEIAGKTGIMWFQSSENFMMSGTFKQVEVSRIYLQQAINQSGGIAVFSGLRRKNVPESQKREENEFHLGDEENEAEVKNIEAEYHVEIPREAKGTQVKLHRFVPDDPQELEVQVFRHVRARVNFGRLQLSSQESRHTLKVIKDKMEVEYRDVSSKECVLYGTFNQIAAAHKLLQDICHGDTVQTQQNSSETVFKVQPQFMKLLKRVYKKKLQEIEEEFCVKIVWSEHASQVQLRPNKTSINSHSYQKGCDAFIDFYQGMYPNMSREVVELKGADDETLILEAINSVEAENDVVIEMEGSKLLVYAESNEIIRSVQALKEMLGLAQGSKRKTRRSQRNLGAREHNKIPQEDRFSLKQLLSNGVNFSLYQSDITVEASGCHCQCSQRDASTRWWGGICDSAQRRSSDRR
ncbi:positive regulation of interleukin-4-mediated signaling pathway [Desmophyllum pertusum]|uniref:Positive regulation of interleukin-4-mediated signaling pathway n=1 Tax=Desmophyllum pertusum TaxID=174260 RepID=A0A9X0CVD1_9CNID|nr:positive regulation of interleukin-4-mediated signaling pathway [Desmophyllum pertusum]